MSTNFDVPTSLPPCFSDQNLYDTLKTLEPRSEVVTAPGLQIIAKRITLGDGTLYFRKVTKTFADFSSAGASFDIELFQLPAAGLLHAIKLRHTAAFTGGAISAYTLSIGITGTLNKYMEAQNVFAAPPTTGGGRIVWAPFFNYLAASTLASLFAGAFGHENQLGATSIRLAAVSTGANLNVATAGSVDAWALYAILN